jgi:hypothetical protein
MKKSTRITLMIWLSITCLMAEDVIERKPLAVGTKMETGQIVNGDKSQWEGGEPDKYYLTNIGVNLTQEVVINHTTELKVGVGGVFYYSFPDQRDVPLTQGTKFGPGVSQAQALFKFGNPEAPFAFLRVGYFPYKYNSDAKNLGEYLLRSMPYPALVTTGGWSITDNALIKAQGLQFSFLPVNGRFKHDILLTSERDFRPQGDFTPSYITEANIGAFQFGAGIAFHHYLPTDGKRLKTNVSGINSGNLVLQYKTFPAFTVTKDPYEAVKGKTVTHIAGQPLTATATDISQGIAGENPTLIPRPDNSVLDNTTGAIYVPDTVIFTTKGIKLSARASFQFQKIVSSDFLSADDLKVYAEVALLGFQNQPAYFEKRSERIPIMFGMNLPTFKLLDILALEVEYFNNPMPDDLQNMISVGSYDPIPSYSGALFPLKYHRDDWKWSLYASKKIVSGFSLRAQVANDHFRAPQKPPNSNLFLSEPVTRSPANWYYVFTLNFGI